MSNKVLVVEDDLTILGVLKYNFVKEGYEVVTASDGAAALETARKEKPELIVLDVMLPEMSGYEVCRILRKEMTIPIIMLTAKYDETDKVTGLDSGADDYMTKPFSMRELLARVRALLRRREMDMPQTGAPPISIGDVTVDPGRHIAAKRGTAMVLTPKEFDLLAFLMQNKGFVYSRTQLLEKIWGYDFPGDTRTVDVHVRWLREKIEDDPAKPRYLITVRGTGYKMEETGVP